MIDDLNILRDKMYKTPKTDTKDIISSLILGPLKQSIEKLQHIIEWNWILRLNDWAYRIYTIRFKYSNEYIEWLHYIALYYQNKNSWLMTLEFDKSSN